MSNRRVVSNGSRTNGDLPRAPSCGHCGAAPDPVFCPERWQWVGAVTEGGLLERASFLFAIRLNAEVVSLVIVASSRTWAECSSACPLGPTTRSIVCPFLRSNSFAKLNDWGICVIGVVYDGLSVHNHVRIGVAAVLLGEERPNLPGTPTRWGREPQVDVAAAVTGEKQEAPRRQTKRSSSYAFLLSIVTHRGVSEGCWGSSHICLRVVVDGEIE